MFDLFLSYCQQHYGTLMPTHRRLAELYFTSPRDFSRAVIRTEVPRLRTLFDLIKWFEDGERKKAVNVRTLEG
jgi:hypothetical protein